MFGHYARVLVDVDLTKALPNEIMVEREKFAFYMEIVYEKLPSFCSYCQSIGHSIDQCNKKEGPARIERCHDHHDQPQPRLKPIYVPKKGLQNDAGKVNDSVIGHAVDEELQADHVDTEQLLNNSANQLAHATEEVVQAIHGPNVDDDQALEHYIPLAQNNSDNILNGIESSPLNPGINGDDLQPQQDIPNLVADSDDDVEVVYDESSYYDIAATNNGEIVPDSLEA